MSNRFTKNAYEYIAFMSGFGLMSYELVAARILAPAIGSSVYVWTSVIGVIMAALSAGYWAGGSVADKRAQPMDIVRLLLVSTGAVLLTLMMADTILAVVAGSGLDVRIQAFTASLLLFAPTSFALGMISPYLARLKNVSLATTGKTIASLSALNSLGGISGTFLTGFIFFAYMGSRESLLLIAGLLFAASWVIEPTQHLFIRVRVSLALLLLAIAAILMPLSPSIITYIDTPTASYRIMDVDYDGRPIRAIATGPSGMQSGIPRDETNDLVFRYTRRMADIVAAAPQKNRILILGGGTFTLPRYFAEKYPDTSIDVVELDPELLPVAREYFKYKDEENINITFQDARTFINSSTTRYDIVLVDVYSDTLIPFSVSTLEYAQQLGRITTPDGVVAVNVMGALNAACDDLLAAINTSYTSQFREHTVYPLGNRDITKHQNMVIVYSRSMIDWLPQSQQDVNIPAGMILTDNFAPVERLKQQCISGS